MADAAVPFWADGGAERGDLYAANPWDRLVIGGVRMPGIVEVDASPSKKADTAGAPGTHGATPKIHGYQPAHITIRVSLWTAEQWNAFQSVLRGLWPRPGKDAPPLDGPKASSGAGTPRQAFDVTHPVLAALGIRSVIVLSVTTPKVTTGARTWTFQCVEFAGSKSTKSTKVTSSHHGRAYDTPEKTNAPPRPVPGANYTPDNMSTAPPSADPKATGP